MIIKSTSFITSVRDISAYESKELPEIALVGKSNVGKSSLINFIANYSKLAYVSKQPGKTRLINFFEVNHSFFIVDLPGYGFSRASKEESAYWAEMIEGYLKKSTQLKLLLVLLDIRHDPSEDDIAMIEWLRFYHIPYAIIATKADKIAKSKRMNCLHHFKKVIGEKNNIDMAAVSSSEKLGKDELLAIMEKYLS